MTRTGARSRQLLWQVVAFSLLLTIASTLLNAWTTYHYETRRPQGALHAVLAAYGNSLPKAVWEFDKESGQVQLSGLSHVDSVLSAEVVANDLGARYAKPQANQQQLGVAQAFPLRSPDGQALIGEWRLRLDGETLRDKVWQSSGAFMMLVVAELLVQALLVFWLAGRAVSTPIHALARHVSKLRALGLSEPAPQPPGRQRNELHQLAEGITQLQLALQSELHEREAISKRLALREQQLLRISQSSVIDAGDLQATSSPARLAPA